MVKILEADKVLRKYMHEILKRLALKKQLALQSSKDKVE
jgi:hypothetical protein